MDWKTLISDLIASGRTQVEIAHYCGCAQTTISALQSGRINEPRHSTGDRLKALHRSRKKPKAATKLQAEA